MRCQNDKPIQGNKKICDECRSNEWFGSKAERWLYSQVERAGIEVLPQTTRDLIDVFEIRKLSIKASIRNNIKYEVGHRYPAKKGGKLIATNLIVIPKFVNTKIGENHGDGLERFKVEKLTKILFSEFRIFVQSTYDMAELAKYKDSEYTGDQLSIGLSINKVRNMEFQRLGLQTSEYEPTLDENENIALDFASACNGEKAFWDNFGKEASKARERLYRKQDEIMSECSFDYNTRYQTYESTKLTISDYDYAIKVITSAREIDDRSVNSGNGRYLISIGSQHRSNFCRDGYRHLTSNLPLHPSNFYSLVSELFERLQMNNTNINYHVLVAVLEADRALLETEQALSYKLFKE